MNKSTAGTQKTFNIIYFGDHWDEYLRRRQQIMLKLSGYEAVSKAVYVELPLTIFSFFKFLSGKALPKVKQAWKRVLRHGLLCRQGKVWILTPITLFPYIPIRIVQDINNRITYWLHFLILRFYKKKLKLKGSILWITHPFAADFINKLDESMLCYDRTEDFAYKHDYSALLKRQMRKNDSKIIDKADLIFVQTKEMLKNFSTLKKNVYLMPNAVDATWFLNTATHNPDMQNIPRPILGYCGNINSRIDFELLRYIVSGHPEWSFVIIGALTPGTNRLSLFKDFKNMHLLGVKSYRKLPAYIKNFDVCLIPHKIDRFTESQSPLKLFDYLAAGRPVVSTNVAGVRDYNDIVKIGKNKEEFLAQIEEILTSDPQENIQKRQTFARQNSWDRRVEEIYQVLTQHVHSL
ncbi:MAG: glycosyltransferase [Candidatus Omnitrophota bacterium]